MQENCQYWLDVTNKADALWYPYVFEIAKRIIVSFTFQIKEIKDVNVHDGLVDLDMTIETVSLSK